VSAVTLKGYEEDEGGVYIHSSTLDSNWQYICNCGRHGCKKHSL